MSDLYDRQRSAPSSRWDADTRTYTNNLAVENFITDLVAVCRKHNMSLGHEDEHGGFLVECKLNEATIEWLKAAAIAPDAEPSAGLDKDGLVDVHPSQR